MKSPLTNSAIPLFHIPIDRRRTRHMHFGVTVPGQLTRTTTQLYWNEVPRAADGSAWDTTNANDSVLNGVTDAAQRASVVKDFTAVPAELDWAALPFSLTQTGSIDRNIHTATSEGPLDLYLETKAVKGFYYVSFRVPGADVGTPGASSGGGPGTGGGPRSP